ncbi:polysaccharide pyruvyl transferase WcaK-like protein [Anaerobacterium chartisolvens]|uniref:Polysaccharide pyruvyl transferase WcaK-like protein n=1 Tax=Anaerobacterium chartisolvens TaxID=1297424 RepID=A0A369ALA5_9FIRM|nr:polysaccharide pyruvyl transferase family protein [Anaerobacterium chartisolvens]RCX09875.1 polysaccharide pyruvyl transferase WcaK-like protein [Anaerobacterium chartisolvens]
MSKSFLLYGHGGAYNHGAEAIVKCTAALIKDIFPTSTIALSTHFKEQDLQFAMPVDDYCTRDMNYVEADRASTQKGLYDAMIYKSTLDKITPNSVCLSVGGDNYCYDNWRKWKTIHERALGSGAKSILWSCSVEPSMITVEMLDTLKAHHLITARESLTYNALRQSGLDNVVLCSDVAFLLEPEKAALPQGFVKGNAVAVNVSPLVVRREIKKGITVENIKNLIRFIIRETTMNVALVPHVVMPMDNDYLLLREIYEELEPNDRICLISDKLSAAQYKYIISKCRLGIFARTHASIAAYSSCVPAIAIGYSVKAKGIAADLRLDDYVLPLDSFSDGYSLLTMFKDLLQNENKLSHMLKEKMPAYKENARKNPACR